MHLVNYYDIIDDKHLLVEYKENEPLYYGTRKITKGKFLVMHNRDYHLLKDHFAIKYKK